MNELRALELRFEGGSRNELRGDAAPSAKEKGLGANELGMIPD